MTRRIVWLFGIGLLGLACASYGTAVAPSERSGLGTAWGEARSSSVRWVSFEREDPLRPAVWVALHSADAAGVGAAAGAPGFAEPPGWGGLRARLVDGGGAPLPTVR